MPTNQISYGNYFHPNDQITIGITLSDNSFMEDSATILFQEDDLLLVELYGNGVPEHLETNPGAEVIITSHEGWALYRCHAELKEKVSGRDVKLRLLGEVEVSQRREYFRMDVMIPLYYSQPADQQVSTAMKEWELRKLQSNNGLPPDLKQHEESFKVLRWAGGDDVLPARINLSGGGIRSKIRDSFTYGSMLHLDIFLPITPLRAIHAIGSVVRSRELLLSDDRFIYYSTAMAFKFIENRDRESIISFIFNQQRSRIWHESGKRV